MLCLDNSEFMRNADYIPSRLEALCDAANVAANAKMNSNPENTVGVMSLAGRNPELLMSPTDDMGKIMTSIHDVELSGLLNFADGVQIAYLALKHRRNKNGGQRIVVFVGSPVSDEVKKLSTLAKMLRKNLVRRREIAPVRARNARTFLTNDPWCAIAACLCRLLGKTDRGRRCEHRRDRGQPGKVGGICEGGGQE